MKTAEAAFLTALGRFVLSRPDVAWIFPVGEAQLFALARCADQLPFRSRLAMVAPEIVLACMDKMNLCRTAAGLGIPVPETATVRDASDLAPAVARIGLPCIVKPNSSLAPFYERKAMVLRTIADVRKVESAWPQGHQFLLVQKFVSGLRNNCHFAAVDGKPVASFQYLTTRTDRADGTGIAVEGYSIAPMSEVEEYKNRLIERLRYSGVGCIQFLLDEKNGVPYLLELNPRLSATTAFSYRLGMDFPLLAVECAKRVQGQAGSLSPPCGGYPVGKRVHWLLGDLSGLLEARAQGDVGFAEGLAWAARLVKAFLRADVRVTWDLRDPRPTAFLYADFLTRRTVRRLLGRHREESAAGEVS